MDARVGQGATAAPGLQAGPRAGSPAAASVAGATARTTVQATVAMPASDTPAPSTSGNAAPQSLAASADATSAAARDLVTRERTVVRHYFPLRVLRRDPRYVVLLVADPALSREVVLLVAARGDASVPDAAAPEVPQTPADADARRTARPATSRLRPLPDDAVAIEDAFKRHAGIAGGLNHPHIVATLDAGRSEGRAFLALERVEGRSLKALLQGEWRPTAAGAVAIAAQLADALRHAHAQGVAHGHLSPEHLYVTEDGTLKVAGFGGWCDIGIDLPSTPMLTPEALAAAGTGPTHPGPAPVAVEGLLPDRRLRDLVALANLLERLAGRAAGQRGPRTMGLPAEAAPGTQPPHRLLPHDILELIRRTRAAAAGHADPAASTTGAGPGTPDAAEWQARLALLTLRDRLAPFGIPVGPAGQAVPVARPGGADATIADPSASSTARQPSTSLVVVPAATQAPMPTAARTASARSPRWGVLAVASVVALAALVGIALLMQRPYGPVDEVVLAPRPQAPASLPTGGPPVLDAASAPRPEEAAVLAAAMPAAAGAAGPVAEGGAAAPGAGPAGAGVVASPPPAAIAARPAPKAAKAAPATPEVPATPAPAPSGPGALALAIAPWGEVYIDGQMKGVTPPLDKLSLPPGTYAVEVRNAAGPSIVRTVTVTPGQTVTLSHRFGG